MQKRDSLIVEANFHIIVRQHGKVVPDLCRAVHNVFTNNGRAWLASLSVFDSIGSPDVPKTEKRVRWIGLGTGTSALEVTGVTQLEAPVKVNDTDYLAMLDGSEFPAAITPGIRFFREFAVGEVSVPSNPVVPISEAGLFVDTDGVYGADDTPVAGLTTTLDPTVSTNSPVAYARFEPIPKTQDFSLEIRWDFRY